MSNTVGLAKRLERLEIKHKDAHATPCSTCKGWGMLLLQAEDLHGQPPPRLCPECHKPVAVKVYKGNTCIDAL